MKYLKTILLLILFVATFISCKQDSKSPSEKSESLETSITDSKEFESYFILFFSLSDENTKTDLPYVNKFMSDNKLFPFKSVCSLLKNELVISNKRIFDYWEVRCNFNNAKDKLMRKYQIDGDSIKNLMQETIADGKYNKKIK